MSLKLTAKEFQGQKNKTDIIGLPERLEESKVALDLEELPLN